jgi:hypothetical protein
MGVLYENINVPSIIDLIWQILHPSRQNTISSNEELADQKKMTIVNFLKNLKHNSSIFKAVCMQCLLPICYITDSILKERPCPPNMIPAC